MSKRRAKGEGSVVLLQDGRYQARVTVAGTRTVAHGRTPNEAMANLRDRLRQPSVTKTSDTVSAFLVSWLETARPTLAGTTYDAYRSNVHNHLVPLSQVPLSQVSLAWVERVQGELLARNNVGIVRKIMSTLSTALNHAVRLGLIPTNPAPLRKCPLKPRYELNVLGLDLCRLLVSCASLGPFPGMVPLALDSGMRQGELFALTWDCVDPVAGTVKVNQSLYWSKGRGLVLKSPKTASSRRTIRLCPETVRHLGTPGKGLIFPNRNGQPMYARNYVMRVWRPLIRGLGIDRFRFHDLRHTCATHLLLAGVPVKVVSARLGHSTVTQTLNTYNHLLPESDGQCLEVTSRFYT
jgi:integrase